jgi:hypothetical protein
MKSLIAFLVVWFAAANVHAEVRTALFYNIGHTDGSPRFTQTIDSSTDSSGNTSWDSKIVDSSGAVLMTEVASLHGSKVLHQYVEQLQINESYELNVEGQEAVFKTFKLVDGKRGEVTAESKAKVNGDFIMGPSLSAFIQEKWTALMAEKDFQMDFGVLEMRRFVNFRFHSKNSDNQELEVQMKPANFFIAMLVDPIIIHVRLEDKKVIRLKGRTPLREKVDGKWKSIDAEIIYHY